MNHYMKKKSVTRSEDEGSTETGSEKKYEKKDFLVVGIGASAGGIKALREFFSLMPSDSGMAFVVILHLSQTHESNLAEILQRETAMKVEQVQQSVKIEPDHVYVIPPAKHLEMIDGMISLKEPERIRGKRVPIDRFFRTLAESFERKAVCIVLSGTGTDGTLGLKHIKERNGFAIVQDPQDAEYDGMLRSAIETKLADVVLPVAAMPSKLLLVRDSTKRLRLADNRENEVSKEIKNIELLRDILSVLRVRTGHDFSNYKRPTLIRRIARHLQIHEIDDLADYLEILREKSDEVLFLLKNLLINVTNFFRDKEAFDILEKQVVPKLFEGKTSADQIRVWVAGCASGEEAYSIAILLQEYAAKISDPPRIQVFASDVDDEAIAEAREGRYTEAIVADVSPERLRQFFTREEDGSGYRIRKSIREMILFAPHNILRDPPFSKLDLVSCRNVLIYLNRETQEKVLQVFHFALRENAFLFLGSSESAESMPPQFTAVNKKFRIYQSRPASAAWTSLLQMPMQGAWTVRIPELPAETRRNLQSYGELHHRLIEQYAPPSILINEEDEILHLSESAGQFLRFVGGEPTNNLLKVIQPALLSDVRAAIFAARQDGKTIEAKNIRIYAEDKNRFINLTVRPVKMPEAFALVIFEEVEADSLSDESVQAVVAGDAAMENIFQQMEHELQSTKDRLRITVEQYETSVEEHRASNEELQAMNEELRSASEELETGKEELQSVNEELTTVNHELKDKIDEIGRANSDLQNLMRSTEIATIFLDRDLYIKRFTPRAQEIFNVILSDVGRPLAHLTHQLLPDDFATDAAHVLQTLQSSEREVRSLDNRYFIARFLPYRTLDDKIDGVVLTFIDITARKKAEDALRESEEKYRTLFDSIDESFCIIEMLYDEAGVCNDWLFLEVNNAYERHTGLKNVVGKLSSEIIPNTENYWLEIYNKVAQTGESVRFEHFHKETERWYYAYASRIGNEKSRQVAVVFNDITDRKHREMRQEYLLKLTDALHFIRDPLEVEQKITEAVMNYFGADRCYFAAINGDEAVIRRDASKGNLESVSGVYRLRDFAIFKKTVEDGIPIVVYNANTSNVLDETLRRICLRLDVISFIDVPIIKNGQACGIFSLVQSEPKNWTKLEIQLIVETAELTYLAITRAQAEKAMRESEDRYRTLFESIDVGFCVIEMIFDKKGKPFDYRFLEANPAFYAQTGFTNAIGKTIREFAPNHEQYWFDIYGEIALSGNPARFEQQAKALNRWYEVYAFRVGKSADNCVAILFRDVVERKRGEKILRESEERLRVAVEAAEMATWDWDIIRDEIVWNEKHFTIFGLEPTDSPQKPQTFFERVHPADLERVNSLLKSAIENKTTFQAEFRIIRHDNNEIHWMEGYGQVTEQIEGKSVRMNGVMSDITERKRDEEALRQSEERLQLIMKSITDYAIITMDQHFIITGWNTGAENTFGYKAEEIIGKSSEILYTPEDLKNNIPRKEIITALKKGFAEDNRRHIRKDGSKFIASGVITPIQDGEIEGFVKITRDQTKIIEAEKIKREKELLQKLVNAQENERRRIARDLHDELGQLLTVLRLKIDNTRQINTDNQSISANIDEMDLIAKRLDDGVDFLAWELRPASLDDLGLLTSLDKYIREWSYFSGITAEFFSSSVKDLHFSPEVEINLYRIVQEALNNVHKYSNARKAEVMLEKRKGQLVLIIADDGVGFNPENMGGSDKGIGLIGMKERASLIGGEFEIESAQNQGTTIYVRVPLK